MRYHSDFRTDAELPLITATDGVKATRNDSFLREG
jgi:hypothetical protein